MSSTTALTIVGSLVVFGCNGAGDGGREHGTASDAVSGAVYTTFDGAQGGCNNSDNGINCNHYDAKEDAYVSGGPSAAGLSDGLYFFAVLSPGSQNGGFVDGAKGNLSDTSPGKKGDLGSGDSVENRMFAVSGEQIVSYTGTHATGTSPNGKLVIQLMPYDGSSNNGGVYTLAVCEVGAASPSQCKYDAFKVHEDKDKDDCGDDDDSCGDDDDSCGDDDGGCEDDDDCGGDDGGCDADCAACGDGVADANEGCDDGNLSSGDGCSADCQVEAPCSQTPDPCE